MPRSPLTLAAAVTAAVPGAVVVRTRLLGGEAEGRYDTAVVDLDDGSRLVVRAAVDSEADRSLRTELGVLESLSDGIRSLLPFDVPRVRGRAALADATAGVVDFLDGYRVAGADLPPGPVAVEIGRGIAAVHDLPVAVVRDAGLPVSGPDRIRVDLSRLLDRAGASGHVGPGLRDRWRAAIDDDALWRFEPTVVLGGTDAERFLFTDGEDGPHLTGVLGWHAMAVGDPAVDLAWLATAPGGAAAVLDAYAEASGRALDALLVERARLHAELEFASWLLHGVELGDDAIVADAAAMLQALDADTRGSELIPRQDGDVAAAVALLDRVPVAEPSPVDTSMQTDSYDAAELAAYLPADEEPAPVATLPVDLSEWTAQPDAEPEPAFAEEAERASRSALRRWADGGLTPG